MSIDISFWIAIVSAITSVVAALYSARATRIAQKTLELAEQQEQRRNPNLNLYLADAYFRRFRDKQFRVYAFHLGISNISDGDNSVKGADLLIECDRGAQIHTNVIVPHDLALGDLMPALEATVFKLPTRVAAHETIDGYVLFRIQDELLHDSAVESYSLKVIHTHGLASLLQPIFVNEARDD